ncbi:HEXXH motif-containing putative peptide modification protein [Kitasatospora sp. NPDC093806]|uniref:aKG-HExxH-type peptide beta-hydroxylase n=1 Tax=Kitasatospora sp. NPDC093806 TaxID=3155075 RepID=UPI00342F9C57
MRVAPDAAQSAAERTVLARTTRSALARAGLTVTPAEAAHPAVVELAHIAQRLLRADPADQRPTEQSPMEQSPAERLGLRLAQLRAENAEDAAGDSEYVADPARAAGADVPPGAVDWPVDLAVPRPHLERSVARALRALPPPRRQPDHGRPGHGQPDDGRPAVGDRGPVPDDGLPATPGSVVVRWREREAGALGEAAALLAVAWPEAHRELGTVLAQIALLEGPAIDGFTDFAVHGAVFVRRDRLAPGPDGLPGPVRLAEALVHEGTHTRCNAASVTAEPFLRPAQGDARLVSTPLRIDPRPLSGLFQQVVVLARSVLLYERLLDLRPVTGRGATGRAVIGRSGSGRSAGGRSAGGWSAGGRSAAGSETVLDGPTVDEAAAIRARHGELVRSAVEGVSTLTRHRDALTERGAAVLADAAAVIRARG